MILLLVGLATASLLICYTFAISLPDLASPLATQVVLFGFVLSAGALVARIGSVVIVKTLKRTGNQISELVVLVISALCFVPFLIVDLSFVLHANLAALLTTSALMTAVAGFALQATLGNLFEGIAIQLNRPFVIGDFVTFGAISGVVEDLSWRAVRVRDDEGIAYVIPNNALVKQPIRVMTRGDRVHVVTKFSVPADIEPSRVIRLSEFALSKVEHALAEPAPECRIAGQSDIPAMINYVADVTILAKTVDVRVVASRSYELVWYALARDAISLLPGSIVLPVARFDALPRNAAHDISSDHLASKVPLLSQISAEARESFLGETKLQKYARGERIPMGGSSGAFGTVILQGQIDVLADAAKQTAVSTFTPRVWSRDVIEPVLEQFTQVMGPIGRQLGLRIAPQATNLGMLYDMLATSIPDEIARKDFLDKRPDSSTCELGAGSTLNFAAVLTGRPLLEIAEAQIETTVLQIEGDALRELLRAHPDDADVFARAIVVEYAMLGDQIQHAVIEDSIRRRLAGPIG